MPKLKSERSPFERYLGLVLARMRAEGLDMTGLAAKMGCTRQTVSNYLADPGLMRLDWMRKMHRVLGIRAEEARELLPMW